MNVDNISAFLLHLSEDVSCAVNVVRLAWKLYKCPSTNKVIIWWRYTKQNFDKKYVSIVILLSNYAEYFLYTIKKIS